MHGPYTKIIILCTYEVRTTYKFHDRLTMLEVEAWKSPSGSLPQAVHMIFVLIQLGDGGFLVKEHGSQGRTANHDMHTMQTL